MSCTVTIKYDRRLVRRALNSYMSRRLGKPFFFALVASIFILGAAYFADIWGWFFTFLAMTIAASLAFLGFVYLARLRASEGFFDKADEPTVTFRFTVEGVETQSELGSTNLKWQVFEEILKFRDVWLLVYAKSGYMTLPLNQLTNDCRQFIDQQVKLHLVK